MGQPSTLRDSKDVDGEWSADKSVPFQHVAELAEKEDRRAFIAQVSRIDWRLHSPAELTKILDLALSLDLTQLAAQLALLGAQLFPEHERIQRAAHVLSSSPARSIPAKSTHGLSASRRWLREHADQYRGRWVAVRDGALIGTASSLEPLASLLVSPEESRSTLITKVL